MHTPLVKLQTVRKSYALGKVDVTALREVTREIDGEGVCRAVRSFGHRKNNRFE